jgi:uncharacterized protein (DUF427 family)
MSLAVGDGPFSRKPKGRFDFDPPKRIRYVEDYPRRVRGSRNGAVVLDSLRVKLLIETGGQPSYCFPEEEANGEGAPAPGIEGYVVVDFDAVETWHEEDEQVFGHVRDPYHRIDVRPSSRIVRISREGVPLADSKHAQALFEAALPPRWYVPREDVLVPLERSATVTVCAYKGFATHWSARIGEELVPDVAWSYESPLLDAIPVRGCVCFYHERFDLELDGVAQKRPLTAWSKEPPGSP